MLYFFACPKKYQKKTPTNDDIPFVGWFPDLALVLAVASTLVILLLGLKIIQLLKHF